MLPTGGLLPIHSRRWEVARPGVSGAEREEYRLKEEHVHRPPVNQGCDPSASGQWPSMARVWCAEGQRQIVRACVTC